MSLCSGENGTEWQWAQVPPEVAAVMAPGQLCLPSHHASEGSNFTVSAEEAALVVCPPRFASWQVCHEADFWCLASH